MKIGVKSYDYSKELKYFIDKADFFEIMVVEGRDYSGFKDFNIPFVIHCQHAVFGINNADNEICRKNLDSFNYARKVADMLRAKKIIVHPGEINSAKCSKETSINFIKSLNDKRIFIENMPKETSLGRTPEEIMKFINETKCGFCFDINHAISFSQKVGKDYKELIKEFLKLKPKHFHLGGHQLPEKDHLCLADSELNLKEIISLLPKDAEITLETLKDYNKTKEDLVIIGLLLKEI